jgi:RNA recognition motif-containing protein
LIGNLPFTCSEEDLVKHFRDVASMESAGPGAASASNNGILNVKVVRDPVTMVGKGIAFIQFTSKMLMRLAIE